MVLINDIKNNFNYDFNILLNSFDFDKLTPYINIYDKSYYNLLIWAFKKKHNIIYPLIDKYHDRLKETINRDISELIFDIYNKKTKNIIIKLIDKCIDKTNISKRVGYYKIPLLLCLLYCEENKYILEIFNKLINKYGILCLPQDCGFPNEYPLYYKCKFTKLYTYIFINYYGILFRPYSGTHNMELDDFYEYDSNLLNKLTNYYGVLWAPVCLNHNITKIIYSHINIFILKYGRF